MQGHWEYRGLESIFMLLSDTSVSWRLKLFYAEREARLCVRLNGLGSPLGIPVVRRILLPLLPVLYATTMLLSEAKHHSA